MAWNVPMENASRNRREGEFILIEGCRVMVPAFAGDEDVRVHDQAPTALGGVHHVVAEAVSGHRVGDGGGVSACHGCRGHRD